MFPLSRVLLIGAVAVVTFAADRFTKSWVVSTIPLNEARDVADGWARIANVRNTGAAFGLLPERTSLLSILSVVAVLVILYYYRGIAARKAYTTTTKNTAMAPKLSSIGTNCEVALAPMPNAAPVLRTFTI